MTYAAALDDLKQAFGNHSNGSVRDFLSDVSHPNPFRGAAFSH